MPSWMPDFLQETRFQLWVGLLVTALFGGWDWLRGTETGPHIVAFSLIVLVCLLWLMDRFWQPSDRIKVRNWLDENGFSVGTERNPDATFFFVARDSKPLNILVYQLKHQRALTFQIQIKIDDADKKRLAQLS